MIGDDVEDDIEIGLSDATFEVVQLPANRVGIEDLGLAPLLAEQSMPRLDTEGTPARLDVAPHDLDRSIARHRAILAVEHDVECIEALTDRPCLVVHEDPVDLVIE